jgi:hypothetical protein
MSSVKDITTSNLMPIDLAKRLGANGIVEILTVFWQGYKDLRDESIITVTMQENEITQEWFIRISKRWNAENRAAIIGLDLIPIPQYEDDTLAKKRGSRPTIDFCFRTWSKSDGYFGAECKNLYENSPTYTKRYVDTGVKHYISGRYGSNSTTSSMIGYVLSGKIPAIVTALKKELQSTTPCMNLIRDMINPNVPQYKSNHLRTLDNAIITLYHLFFDFAT